MLLNMVRIEGRSAEIEPRVIHLSEKAYIRRDSFLLDSHSESAQKFISFSLEIRL